MTLVVEECTGGANGAQNERALFCQGCPEIYPVQCGSRSGSPIGKDGICTHDSRSEGAPDIRDRRSTDLA